MLIERFVDLIEKLKAQHLPFGNVELFDKENLSANIFFEISSNISQIMFESEENVLLISKITPTLFLQLSAKKSSCNIGILKNAANKVSDALRSNAMFSST